MINQPIILITGASSGIGWELMQYFLLHTSYTIIPIARTMDKALSEMDSWDHKRIYPISIDVTDAHATKHILDLIQNIGKIQFLVNNAGTIYPQPIADTTDEQLHQQFNTNTIAPFRLIRDLLPLFAKPAHVVNISSMGGVQGSVKFFGLSAYSASKGALNILTECLALELAEKHISVNALALGATETQMFKQTFPGYQASMTATAMARHIAGFVLDGYKYTNGKVIQYSQSTP